MIMVKEGEEDIMRTIKRKRDIKAIRITVIDILIREKVS